MAVDLRIDITAPEPPENGHNVTVSDGASTEYGDFSLSAVSDAVDRIYSQLARPSPDRQSLQQAGSILFDQLLGGGLYRPYMQAATRAADADQALRLRIHSDHPGPIAVPWEYLYDEDRGHFPALRADFSLTRGLPLPSRKPTAVDGPLRVLAMISDPSDLEPLNGDRELANLRQVEATGVIDLTLAEPTYAALQTALRQGPHVFHFVGHGSFPDTESLGGPTRNLRPVPNPAEHPESQGMLAFRKEDGTADLIEASRLAPLLSSSETLGLIVLNACEGAVTGEQSAFAGLTQQLIRQEAPAVLAMQSPIFDEHALRFSREFYAALADGYEIEQAVHQGRMAISGLTASWGIPTFYLQSAQPLSVQPQSPEQRADFLWRKAQEEDRERQRLLLAGALAVDPNHAGATLAMQQMEDEREAEQTYAAALAYMESEAWRDAHRVLLATEKLSPNFRDTRSRLAEVLGRLDPDERTPPEEVAEQMRHYRPMLNALQEGRLVPFLGWGVGRFERPRNDPWVEGLYPPDEGQTVKVLSDYLAEEPDDGRSLPEISQHMVLLEDETALHERLYDLYRDDYAPTILHRLLAEIPRRLRDRGYPRRRGRRYVICSAAFDNLLERAFHEAAQPFHLFAYRPHYVDADSVLQQECFLHYPPRAEDGAEPAGQPVWPPNTYSAHDDDDLPIIVKLCGRYDAPEPDSVVVTEDDYLDYLPGREIGALLPATLMAQLQRRSFLFFGYSLQPWHLRLLWQRMRYQGQRLPGRSWAVVSELNELERAFWTGYDVTPIAARPEGVVAYVNRWLDDLEAT